MASLLDAFLANWATPPALETSFQTLVTRGANSVHEVRRALAGRPSRLLTVTWTPTTRAELVRLLQMLANATDTEVVVPLVMDQAKVTANSSGTTVTADPTYRRIKAGGLVVVHGLNDVANAQVRTVNTVGGSSFTVTSGLTGTITAGGYAYPGLACRMILAPRQVTLQTGRVGSVQAVFQEIRGAQALPGFETLGSTGAFSTAADPDGNGTYPVCTQEPDWSLPPTVGWARDGYEVDWALDRGVYPLGDRPRFTCSATWTGTDRATSVYMQRLFAACGGRLMPFWMLSPVEQWNVESKSSTSIEITAESAFGDLTLYTAVGLVLRDGTRIVRPITSRVDSGSTYVLGWSAAATFDLEDVVRACPAYFVRFQEDALTESWSTENVCRVRTSVVEILSDADVEITNIAERNAACECFTPLDLGPIAWWRQDGDDVTVDGANNITLLTDLVGVRDLEPFNTGPTLVPNELGGLPVMRFGGAGALYVYDPAIAVGTDPLFLQGGATNPFPATVVMLIRCSLASPGGQVAAYYSTYNSYINHRMTPTAAGWRTVCEDNAGSISVVDTSTGYTQNVWIMLTGYFESSTTRAVRVNRQTKVSQTTSKVTWNPNVFSLGDAYGRAAALGGYAAITADIAEPFVFGRVLSDADHLTLAEYYEGKYGVSII